METNDIKNSLDHTGLHGEKVPTHNAEDANYLFLVDHIQKTLNANFKKYGFALFHSATRMKDAPDVVQILDVDLRKAYVATFPLDRQQYYTCQCCFSFLKHYGDLVFIDKDGKTHSAIWNKDGIPEDNFFYSTVAQMQSIVEGGRVTDAFKTKHATWGTREAGGWNHLVVTAPREALIGVSHKTAFQHAAMVKDDFTMLQGRLDAPRYSLENLTKLQRILEANVLANQQVIVGPARFLFDLATSRDATKNHRVKDNLTWLAAATASKGLMHSDVCDNLLLALSKGADFDEIKRNFGAMTRPDEYRRPVVGPTNGNIDEAEKFIEFHGAKDSLRRRAATLNDVPAEGLEWKWAAPQEEAKEEPTSVFGHLRPTEEKSKPVDISVPRVSMSWNKFVAEVLPTVTDIEAFVPGNDFFTAFATAAVAEAPPILVYDTEEFRVPVSFYMKHGRDTFGRPAPVPAGLFALTSGAYTRVLAIVKGPQEWAGVEHTSLSKQRTFVLEGGYDTQIEQGDKGIALFPQLLKQEWHEFSAVIEAYSNASKFEGEFKNQAVGLTISKGSPAARLIRITTELGKREILIDRWE